MVSTLKLVERQIAMSEIRRRLGETVSLPGRYVTEDGIGFGPCLLISRECGSGGTSLAQAVGKRLGWNVFDSEIVDEIAQMSRLHRRLVQSVDEHIHSRWEQTWREFLLDDLPDKKYLLHLRQVILTLGYQGNVVLVGRGAKFFLPSPCALRVRLVAPEEQRQRYMAHCNGWSIEEARSNVKTCDQERAAFVRKIFKKDIGAAVYHDLIINTGKFSMEDAAELVLAAIKAKLGVDVSKPLRESPPAFMTTGLTASLAT